MIVRQRLEHGSHITDKHRYATIKECFRAHAATAFLFFDARDITILIALGSEGSMRRSGFVSLSICNSTDSPRNIFKASTNHADHTQMNCPLAPSHSMISAPSAMPVIEMDNSPLTALISIAPSPLKSPIFLSRDTHSIKYSRSTVIGLTGAVIMRRTSG